MKNIKHRWLALAGIVLAAGTFTAWKSAGKGAEHYYQSNAGDLSSDTIPSKKKIEKRSYRMSELDQSMEELERSMKDLDKDLKIDLGKIDKEVKLALDQVKKIDFDKLDNDIRISLDKIDWNSIRHEVNLALEEAQKSVRTVNKEAIRAGIDAAKQSIEINGDLIEGSVKLGLEAAKLGIRKAKQEIKMMKEFINELDKDGLIDKDDHYKLRVKDRELYIDGKKQSKAVNEKYSKYFHSGDYTISIDGDDDHDDDDDMM